MHIAILTFDAFNDLDSLVAYAMLNRIALLGDADWQVRIASPTPRVTSMNGLTIDAHEDLSRIGQADAVLIGSGMKTREVAANPAIMGQLGVLNGVPACTDLTSKPWVLASGVDVVNQPFIARGNVATAGGCMAAPYLVAWLIARLKGIDAAREVMYYYAPVGEKEATVDRAMAHVMPTLAPQALAA